jgi:hypothetical protein
LQSFIQEGEKIMTPKTRNDINPGEPGVFESFPKPNTIPGGWEVSAFHAPERDNYKRSEPASMTSASSKQATDTNEQS